MDWKTLQGIITQIINAIQNTGVAAVRSINKTVITHTYKVKVDNPVKEVKVEGRVKVQNQKDVEQEVKKVAVAIKALEKALAPLKSVEVKNFPKYPEFPKFPEFPKIPEHPKSVEINNLEVVINGLKGLEKTINELDLKPKINVAAPVIPAPIVNVPKADPPTVNVEKPDLSQIKKLVEYFESLDAKHPLAVRLSDGKAFYKAVDRIVEAYTSNNSSPFMDANGDDARAMVGEDGRLDIQVNATIATPSTIRNSKTTVTTAGTRVVLAASNTIQAVVIQAVQSNTGTIYVGDSSVSSTNGYELIAGQAIGVAIDNLNKIYIDASANSQSVTYIGS